MNPNISSIRFKCVFHTQFGQELRIVGNIEELGCWELEKSMKMETNNEIYPTWISTSEITLPKGVSILYKYVLYDKKSKTFIWESLPNNQNRKYQAVSPGLTTINDQKGKFESYYEKTSNDINLNEEIHHQEYLRDFKFIKKPSNIMKNDDIFSSLNYDSNQFSGNDMNETLFFCMSQKMTTEDRIIICSAHLPFEIEKNCDGKFCIKVIDDSLIYSILYKMKESEFCEVYWIGMLKNFMDFSEDELNDLNQFLETKNIFIVYTSETEYKNYWIYMNNILAPIFVENTIDMHNKYLINYEEFFNSYKSVNQKFADIVYNQVQESDLIMINDAHLMLIPNTLLTKNANARVGIYFHMAIPSSDVFKTFPYHLELLKSVLLCDIIGFHVFQFARNFFTLCKRSLGIFHEIKFRGFFTLNYLGRHIIVRIMHAGIDSDYIKSVISRKDFQENVDKYKKIIDSKFALVSVDSCQISSGLLLKLEAYDKFLKKNPGLRNNIILLQIVKYDRCETIYQSYEKELDESVNDIKKSYGENSIYILKVNKFSVEERFAILSLGDVLFYLQIREGNCMYVNEYIALQDLINKDDGRFKFGIIISENIGVSSSLKGAFRVNPYNLTSIAQVLERSYYMKYEEREMKFKKDLEYVKQNTTFSWVKNFFIDLKRTSGNQSSTKIGIGMGLNFRLLKLNANFQHLKKAEFLESYKTSRRRLLFFDYEGTLMTNEDESSNRLSNTMEPSARLLNLLTALTNDPKNLVFIVTGRQRKFLTKWFSSVPNLCLAAEHGFFYNYRNQDEWKELFSVKDWKWKDSVIKILEGFTQKTEGSFVVAKEAIMTWYYKDCEVYFGHVQANEIKTHLQNIFENCKMDIVNGKGYVEIKPRNVNKGYFVSQIIKNEFIERNCFPDFIFAIGDDTSDEEMFNYLNSIQSQLNFYNENIKQYTCTIGRNPSSAKYYLNEVQEVLDYLESLNLSNSLEKKKRFSAFKSGDLFPLDRTNKTTNSLLNQRNFSTLNILSNNKINNSFNSK